MPVLETNNLRKRYRRIVALGGVTLSVKEGEIYGLLGQNGAGKTTLVKIMLGIASGWEGEARLLGDVRHGRVRSRVGYLPKIIIFPIITPATACSISMATPRHVQRLRAKPIPEMLEKSRLSPSKPCPLCSTVNDVRKFAAAA